MRRLLPHPAAEIDLAEAFATPDGDYLRAVFVSSVDGAATDGSGRSGGLSGETDRRLFLGLRESADAVLVGAGTVRVEGYGSAGLGEDARRRRTARGLAPTPPIVVVSGSLAFHPSDRVFTETRRPPILLTSEAAAARRGEALAGLADIWTCGSERVDLPRAIALLRQRGLRRIQFEGGPTLFRELLSAGVVDELCLTISPTLVAGDGPRILHGGPPYHPPRPLHLTDLFADDDGFLFARYRAR